MRILPTSSNVDSNPYDLSLIRDSVTLEEQAATSYIKTIELEEKEFQIGFITIPSFYQDFAARRQGLENYKSTTSDVKNIVSEFREIGIDALIVDLRGNSGGLLDEAVSLTGLFIKDGPIDISVLKTHIQNAPIANFKRPKAYLFLDNLPRNAANKILRRELCKIAEEERRNNGQKFIEV